jgi:hypothetical protein
MIGFTGLGDLKSMFDVSSRAVSLRGWTPRETPAVQANMQKILAVVEVK